MEITCIALSLFPSHPLPSLYLFPLPSLLRLLSPTLLNGHEKASVYLHYSSFFFIPHHAHQNIVGIERHTPMDMSKQASKASQ